MLDTCKVDAHHRSLLWFISDTIFRIYEHRRQYVEAF